MPPRQSGRAMRCLYEVLEVEREVDEPGLKRAYRLLALKWHPDKNQDNLEAAEERFKEIQNAYEILSDPHERAWYDSHRESILRSGERYQAGGGGFEGGQRPADEEDLFQYFSPGAFSGFGDGLRGFYGVYDDLFQRLAKQEGEAHEARADRKGKRPPGPFPRFGLSDASWADVSAFYAWWASFSSVKDFAWADQYHTGQAPNRKVRRAMDAENEKARRAAKREYCEAVRELVAFLRKRDKRVVAHQMEEAKKREQRQAEEAARREAERQERLAAAAAYQEAAWMRGEEEGEGSTSEEEDLAEEAQLVWYCVACEKHFKSEAALDNHERSKRHLAQVELLRQVLEEEEAELAAAGAAAHAEDDAEEEEEEAGSSDEEGSSSDEEGSESDEEDSSSSEEDSGSGSGSSSEGEAAPAPTQQQRRQQQQRQDAAAAAAAARAESSEESEEESEEEEESELGEDDMLARLVAAQRSGGAADGTSSSGSESESESESKTEESDTSEESEAGSRGGGAAAAAEKLAAVQLDAGGSDSDSDWGAAKPGKQRGKQRGGKKPPPQRPAPRPAAGAEPQQPQEQPVQPPPQQEQQQGAAPKQKPSAKEKRRQRQAGAAAAQAGAAAAEHGELECGVCRAVFDTRNQLFKHIKTTGHAAAKR